MNEIHSLFIAADQGRCNLTGMAGTYRWSHQWPPPPHAADRCYFASMEYINWTTGNEYCQRWGGHLLSIHRFEDLDLLMELPRELSLEYMHEFRDYDGTLQ